MIRLVIEKMPEGGFVVGGVADFQRGEEGRPLLACTNIADALAFIGDKLAPVERAHADKATAPTIGQQVCVNDGHPCRCEPDAVCHRSVKGCGASPADCKSRHPGNRCKACPFAH